MLDFEFCSPTKIVLGRGAEAKAGQLIKNCGGGRVLVHHSGGHAVRSGLIDRVLKAIHNAGLYCIELDGVVPNPRLDLVHKGIDLCRREKIDFILAVGGGSVIDSAKAIAMGVPYDGDVWNFFSENKGEVKDVPKKKPADRCRSDDCRHRQRGVKQLCYNQVGREAQTFLR